MTSDRNPDPGPQRIVVLGSEATARRLRELLVDEPFEVVSEPRAGDLETRDADLVLIPEEQLETRAEGEVLDIADDERAPGVAVLSETDDPDERARLAAAGATVLDVSEPGELSRQVARLAGGDVTRTGPGESGDAPRLADFRTRSAPMREFLDLVERVAASEASILLRGETGVGKSRLARAIHTESARADEPFVELNCGAIPAELIEGELFGAEPGAYTGADRLRRGHFERAHRGTVFLDEVAELAPDLQVKLLTVLQRRRVRRLGGGEDIPVDVRVIAATNRELDEEIASGRFREDLFYRLSVVPLVVPPLRDHLDDIPELVGGFLRHFRELAPDRDLQGIEPRALDVLMNHHWPGNVRELANVIERAVAVGRGPLLVLEDLPEPLRGRAPPTDPAETPTVDRAPPVDVSQPLREARQQVVRHFEQRYLDALLRETEGHIARTAERAGISPRALYDKMKTLGLRKEDYRP